MLGFKKLKDFFLYVFVTGDGSRFEYLYTPAEEKAAEKIDNRQKDSKNNDNNI